MTVTPQPSYHRYSQAGHSASVTTSPGGGITSRQSDPETHSQESFQELFSPQNVQSAAPAGGYAQGSAVDELTKLFNSAVVSTRTEKNRDFSAELYQLVQTPAFSAILSAIKLLARSQGMPEHAAAEQIISTFRKLDSVWADYIFQEGVDRLRNP